MKGWQTCWMALALGCTSVGVWAPMGQAQAIPLQAAFNNAYFSNSPDFFQGVNIWNQLNNLFGFNGYPEQQITRDTMRVTELYNQVLDQQLSADPTLRVADACNPFADSLGTCGMPQPQPMTSDW